MLLGTIDTDGNGTVELDELQQFFSQANDINEFISMAKSDAQDSRGVLRKVFRMFDKANTGRLNEEAILDITKFLGLDFKPSTVQMLMVKMDEDGDGTVELEEFFEFFTKV